MSEQRSASLARKYERFARVPLAVISDHRISNACARVLICVSGFSNAQTNKCHPSVGTIASRLGTNERGIQKHLRRLEACGYLQIDPNFRSRGVQSANVYTLLFPTVDVRGRVVMDATPTLALATTLRGVTATTTQTRPIDQKSLNKSSPSAIGQLVRHVAKRRTPILPSWQMPGSEWNAVVTRMATHHGFDLETAWLLATDISPEDGAAKRLNSIMANAEMIGASAHQQILEAAHNRLREVQSNDRAR